MVSGPTGPVRSRDIHFASHPVPFFLTSTVLMGIPDDHEMNFSPSVSQKINILT